jgi:hypothetical protein
MVRVLAWPLALMTVASPVAAQRQRDIAIGASREMAGCADTSRLTSASCAANLGAFAQSTGTTSAWAPVASAVFPGTGQAILGVNRALPYVIVEAFGWTSYVRHSQEYRRRRDGYRDLAARVARAAYSTLKPNGDFEYYERMSHYQESGRYDVISGGRLNPETDTTTYNGAVWLLARRTYWADPSVVPDTTSPEWTRAVAFYRARAYDQLYRWSWTQAPLEYAAFVDLIGESNDANRRAMLDLGVIIANHVLSTVDAYITLRLRHDVSRQEFAIEGTLPLGRLGWTRKRGSR